jgi:membrane protein implicated in regulation of membrane protease activity
VSRPRRLSWGGPPDAPPPRQPYRDTVVLYAVLSALIVLVAWLTDGRILPGDLGKAQFGALLIAVAFFAVATAYSIWQWRSRQRREAEERARRGEEAAR